MPPSRAEIYTGWAAAIKVLDQTEAYGRSNATNLLGLIDTVYQAIESDYADEITQALEAVRSGVASTISQQLAAAVQRPFLKQFCQSVIARTDLTSDAQMCAELYKYFVDNTQRVSSMNYTFGSPAAVAGNVGNGQIIRLNTDDRGFKIEGQHIDSKRMLCVADYQTGTSRGEEVFQILGQASGKDDLQRSGSGIQGILTAVSADGSMVNNATWSQFGGTAVLPTSITDWTTVPVSVSSTEIDFDGTNYFRAAPSDSTPYALRVKASLTLSQKLSVKGTKLSYGTPYGIALLWNAAVGSGVGTLVVRLGTGASTTVAVSGQSGWQVTLVPATNGIGNWYRVFGADDMSIGIQWTRTSGNLLLDDILVFPLDPFNGSWYKIVTAAATAYTPFRVLDSFTAADNSQQTGKNQKWFTREFPGFYLPHAVGSGITWRDA